MDRIHRITDRAERRGALTQRNLNRLDEGLTRLQVGLQNLADGLSWRHGVRLEDLVINASDEIRLEYGAAVRANRVSVILDDAARLGSTWIPRREHRQWLDLIRNLIRNAVQAVLDRPAREDLPPGEVRVSLSPMPEGLGTQVGIMDNGIGIEQQQVEAIWKEGVSRRGTGHGQGLTEEKRLFLQEHAVLDVFSQPGHGTQVRMGVPIREIGIPQMRLARARLAIAWIIIVALAVTAAIRLSPSEGFGSTEVRKERILVGHGDRGGTLWERNLGEVILENLSGFQLRSGELSPAIQPHETVRDPAGRIRGVLVSTIPDEGAGAIWMLDATNGADLWHLRFEDVFPGGSRLGRFISRWQIRIPWSEDDPSVFAVNIRDQAYSPNAIQILLPDGRAEATYFHSGNLAFRACADFDEDGRRELLLYGINNPSRHDPNILGFDPGCFVDCLVMIELPFTSAQGFPYTGWAGVPPANEEGYLLLPPIQEGLRAAVHVIDIARPASGQPAEMDIRLVDGRIYRVDARLRPLHCSVGDDTPAEHTLLDRDPPPVVYVQQGAIERMATPIVEQRN